MNRVELIGGIVREPTLTILPSGTELGEFTLAVSGTRYDRESRSEIVETTYVACQVWQDAAERLMDDDLKPGDSLYVLGALSQQQIEKKDGSKDTKTRIRVYWWNVIRSRSYTSRAQTSTTVEPPF